MERDQDEVGTAGASFVYAKSDLCSLTSDLDEVRENYKGVKANIGRTPSQEAAGVGVTRALPNILCEGWRILAFGGAMGHNWFMFDIGSNGRQGEA